MLVDSHCHLDFPEFAEELDAVVERAGAAGIGWMLTINTHLSKFEGVRAVAERFDNIWCTVGIHPHEAGREAATDAAQLQALAAHPKVVGFGETGLDYYYEKSPREDQKRNFRAHLQASREACLPVIVHARDADRDTADILEDEYAKGPFSGLLHCFSSGAELAHRALDLGMYISFSGIVTFKNADEVRAVAKSVPLNRLLVETDAPFLAPIPMRGKRNEPAFTAYTAAAVAELRGMTEAELAEATTANFFRLFTKTNEKGAA
ncbi:MAG: TatD family hydrolase [Rhodospirillales bacterium]